MMSGGVSSETSPAVVVEINVIQGDELSIQQASDFMVNAFWLGDSRLLLNHNNDDDDANDDDELSSAVANINKDNLLADQHNEFVEKYGERMGKRLLPTCLLVARGANEKEHILGLVGMEVSLMERRQEPINDGDTRDNDIMDVNKAEAILKQALASLGPKQRRLLKDASLEEIVGELLPDKQAVCCLSNLAISPTSRRQGIALRLCQKVEDIALKEWEFDSIHLKVEVENTKARKLYEERLGYTPVKTIPNAVAIRVDLDSGNFVETESETLIMSKSL